MTLFLTIFAIFFCFVSYSATASECNLEFANIFEAKRNCLLFSKPESCIFLGALPNGSGGSLAVAFVSKSLNSFFEKEPPSVVRQFKMAIESMTNAQKNLHRENSLYQRAAEENRLYETDSDSLRERNGSKERDRIFDERFKKTLETFDNLVKKESPEFKKWYHENKKIERELRYVGGYGYWSNGYRNLPELSRIFPQQYNVVRPLLDEISRIYIDKKNEELNEADRNKLQSLRNSLYDVLNKSTDTRMKYFKIFLDMPSSAYSKTLLVNEVKQTLKDHKPRISGGAAGAFGGALVDGVLSIADAQSGNINIKRCREELKLTKSEAELLSGVPPRVEPQGSRHCDSLVLTSPGDIAEQSFARYGKITPGICAMMKREEKRLENWVGNRPASQISDCKSFTDGTLSLSFKKGEPTSFEHLSGKLKYRATIADNTSWPNFFQTEVFDLTDNRKKNEEAKFYNNYTYYNPVPRPPQNWNQKNIYTSCRGLESALPCDLAQSAVKANVVTGIYRAICAGSPGQESERPSFPNPTAPTTKQVGESK